jgi:hypothetical protein
MYIYHKLIIIDIPSFKLSLTKRYLFILLSTTICFYIVLVLKDKIDQVLVLNYL